MKLGILDKSPNDFNTENISPRKDQRNEAF